MAELRYILCILVLINLPPAEPKQSVEKLNDDKYHEISRRNLNRYENTYDNHVGIEYAPAKVEDEPITGPSEEPVLSKISDTLTGEGPGFPTAIANHLLSPITAYQPLTKLEVAPPTPLVVQTKKSSKFQVYRTSTPQKSQPFIFETTKEYTTPRHLYSQPNQQTSDDRNVDQKNQEPILYHHQTADGRNGFYLQQTLPGFVSRTINGHPNALLDLGQRRSATPDVSRPFDTTKEKNPYVERLEQQPNSALSYASFYQGQQSGSPATPPSTTEKLSRNSNFQQTFLQQQSIFSPQHVKHPQATLSQQPSHNLHQQFNSYQKPPHHQQQPTNLQQHFEVQNQSPQNLHQQSFYLQKQAINLRQSPINFLLQPQNLQQQPQPPQRAPFNIQPPGNTLYQIQLPQNQQYQPQTYHLVIQNIPNHIQQPFLQQVLHPQFNQISKHQNGLNSYLQPGLQQINQIEYQTGPAQNLLPQNFDGYSSVQYFGNLKHRLG